MFRDVLWCVVSIKGEPNRLCEVAWKPKKMCKYVHLHALFGSSVIMYTKGIQSFLLRISVPQGASMLIHFLRMKSKKRLARDVFNTFATHASLISDVTDIDCSVQTGSSRGRVFSEFQTSSFDKQDEKLCSKLFCVYFLKTVFKTVLCLLFKNCVQNCSVSTF